ncbi:MAG: NAD+ synthase [Phycisphaeraceae bacterium]
MRIALAQTNPTVGDIDGNARLIAHAIERAADAGAELVVLPELAILGYPPRDLLLKPVVVGECVEAVEALAAHCTAIAAIIGYPAPSTQGVGRRLYNAAALCADGRILHRHYKRLLPTYDVFDEHRYFEPGPVPYPAALHGTQLGISICEDLWNDPRLFTPPLYHENPIDELAEHGAQVLINCAASPFAVGKHELRLRLMKGAARKHHVPLLFCNQVGGNDELVFDGNSCAVDHEGNLLAHAKDFTEDLLLVDVPLAPETTHEAPPLRGASPPANRNEPVREGIAAAHAALVLGLRDYCRKCGFDQIVLGLSGGIDSAVSAAICVAALGRERVRGISMPSRYSSEGSKHDAQQLAQNLGITYDVVPIEQPHAAFDALLQPYFEGLPRDATEENIQARIRGVILMAFSNKFRALLVSTGNKSELAVGYCTLYGDMAGGLAVLSDVPKTMVYKLARWINDDPASPLRQQFGKPVIPEDTITKPPSAELRPDQKDQDSLPTYDALDEIIERYVEREESAQHIITETGIDAEVVLQIVRMIDVNEYKRKQAAPGLKITGRAFGVGRRMPLAQRYDARRALMNAKG